MLKVEIVAKHFAKEQRYQQEQETNGRNGKKHTERRHLPKQRGHQ